jgi:Phytanoyl-CoA dioxygenase (PhyH)
LVREGYLVLRQLLPPEDIHVLAYTVSRLAEVEMKQPGSELYPGQNIYMRSILDKDAAFHRLLELRMPLLIARAVLGPHVWLDAEARMTFAGVAGITVPWHNHIPVIPNPQPAFFCYPHQLHCLIYLDRVGIDEGLLYVLPGSHLDPAVRIKLGDDSDIHGQHAFTFQAGDAVLMHGNLWHRVGMTTAAAGNRRLLLLGYVPSWVRGDTGRGVKAQHSLVQQLRRAAEPEMLELLGDFLW